MVLCTVATPVWAEEANCPGAGNTATSGGSSTGSDPIEYLIEGTCWNCILPISIGVTEIGSGWDYPDSYNPGGSYICHCGFSYFAYYGLEFGWWAPSYIVDVVRQKGCAPGLNGEKLDIDTASSASGSTSSGAASTLSSLYDELRKFGLHVPNEGPAESVMKDGFYNAHIYENFVMFWFNDEMDDECVIQDSEYTSFFTELDDGWNNDVDAALWAPDSLLFGNLGAQMACAADCAVASVSTSVDVLYWCAGCQGSIFPLSGHVSAQVGAVQGTVLLAERLLFKQARSMDLQAKHAHFGEYGLIHGYCYQGNEFVLHKQHYKYQTYWPIKGTDDPYIGGCCYPYGRSTTFMEMMREYPSGEDYIHGIWEKRHCCID